MERDEFHCQICMDGESTLHVHHKRYVKGREPWEYELYELATVCEHCHEEAHAYMDQIGAVASRFPIDGGPQSIGNVIALMSGFFDGHQNARGICNQLEEHIGISPEHYLLGKICSYLQAPTHGSFSQHSSSFFDVLDALEVKGSTWVVDRLLKSIKEANGES